MRSLGNARMDHSRRLYEIGGAPDRSPADLRLTSGERIIILLNGRLRTSRPVSPLYRPEIGRPCKDNGTQSGYIVGIFAVCGGSSATALELGVDKSTQNDRNLVDGTIISCDNIVPHPKIIHY